MDTHGRRAGSAIGFKTHLQAEVVIGDAVYIFSERGVTTLAGECIESLAPLLDGTRDLEALHRDIQAPDVSREQVSHLVERLADAGLVAERRIEATEHAEAYTYWEANGLDPASAIKSACAPVRLITVGAGLDHTAVQDALQSAGLAVSPAGGELSIVLSDDYLAPELEKIDADHRATGRPWLLARPAGGRVWIGPIFEPRITNDCPCWHCLADRLRGHRPAEALVQSVLGRDRPVGRPVATLPALASAALNLIALEAVKWLAGQRYPGQRCVWTFDSADLQGRRHEVRRRPQCRVCGDPRLVSAQTRQPVILESRHKLCGTGGGHRTLPPEQVIDRYRHLVSPISGVVKEIRRDPRGPAFLNVFQSGPAHNRLARSARGLRRSMRFQNGGKGITPAHAEASALCEALERYCGLYHGDEETTRGSMRSLGDLAVDPNACQLYDDRQFADRDRWNAEHSSFQYVSEPFDQDAVVRWTPVWSLTDEHHKLLPTSMLYFGAPHDAGVPVALADSNGNAAGTSLEDAVLQGLFEVIERDAVALWWYNRTRQPAVDLDAFHELWLEETREGYKELGRELWVLDLTADLDVPVMAAVSRRVGAPREHIALGFGAHSDPRIALRRAVTEMNQLVPALLQEHPPWLDQGFDLDADRWWRTATVDNQPYLLPDPTTRPRAPFDYGYKPCPDLRDDVETVHGRLQALGLELLVLNQTRPDIGLPVVKVIVPGMRHFWARFAPGRLFDVAVRLGRLARPTAYEDLNPFPMFL